MKKILTFMLAATLLVSCQKEENETTSGANSPISISPIITRATEVNFENGDRIGVTITRSGDVVYIDNAAMTYSDNLFSGSLHWYPEGNDKSQIVAYYPYNEAGTPTSVSVQTDQSTGYVASDFMAASKLDVMPSPNAISMNFKHMFTNMVIHVEKETAADITSIVLKGSIPTATVDAAALTVRADANVTAQDIKAETVTANTVYRAIVVPQTVAFTLEVATSDGKTLTQRLTSTTLVQGGQYSVDVRVLPGNLEITLSGDIENWTNQGEIGADNEIPFEEHLDKNYFLYGDVRYGTVTLSNGTAWMTEPLAFLPKGFTPSTDPTADAHIWYPYQLIGEGSRPIDAASAKALTDEASIKKLGYLYDMYAALGGKEVTADNCYSFEGVQGICPKGWHIPTREEFLGLSGLSNKAVGETGNKIDKNALFYDPNYGAGNLNKFNEGQWNYVLSGVRMQTNFAATGTYQLNRIYSGNVSKEIFEKYDNQPSLTFIMSSTCYQPTAKNIQFFGQMTTFNAGTYPDGRINVAYVSIKSGQQLRCIRN